MYYLMDFEAKIEGEIFAFKSKVACKPHSTSDGKMGTTQKYDVEQRWFGMKLSSGKGAFVSAPNLCPIYLHLQGTNNPEWRNLENQHELVPLIYLTDNFENPQSTRVFIHPAGPPQGAPIRLIRSTVTPISAENADDHSSATAGDNDPNVIEHVTYNKDHPSFGMMVLKLDGVSFDPYEVVSKRTGDDVEIFALEDKRHNWLLAHTQNYFMGFVIGNNIPPSEVPAYMLRSGSTVDKNLEDKISIMRPAQLQNDNTFEMSQAEQYRGQLIFYPPSLRRAFNSNPARYKYTIVIGSKTIKLAGVGNSLENFIKIGPDYYFVNTDVSFGY